MASNPYTNTIQSDNARAAIAEVKTLTVDRLKKILRAEALTVSGIKSELQFRLISHIERCAAHSDFARIDRVRSAIKGVTGFSNPYPSPYSNPTPASSLSPQFASPTPRNPPPLPHYPMAGYGSSRLSFQPSPFYTVIKSLSPVTELKIREQTRDTARINLRLDQTTIDQLQRDPHTRVMVFGAAESLNSRYEPCDVAFPQHGELKCNSDDVKHNLKGIKGKPGTTRPADITQYIRKSSNYLNQVDLVYALTTKAHLQKQKYYLVVNLVQKKPIESLVNEIKLRRTPFLKERVIKEKDTEIVATSTNMSLKDPLQMTRIQVPCRGLSCRHNGCFDAAVFLALQEQAPTWTCPICHKPAAWDNIAYDEYYDDILRNVDSDAEQVTIEPDGRWRQEEIIPSEQNNGDGSAERSHNDDYDDLDDEDDVVEITDSRMSGSRDIARTSTAMTTPPLNSTSVTPAPPSASSTHSFSDPAAAAARSNKRPHSETIDLTLDDSDDNQLPVSRVKRSSLSSQSSEMFRIRPPHPEPYRFQMPPPSSTSFGQHHYSGF